MLAPSTHTAQRLSTKAVYGDEIPTGMPDKLKPPFSRQNEGVMSTPVSCWVHVLLQERSEGQGNDAHLWSGFCLQKFSVVPLYYRHHLAQKHTRHSKRKTPELASEWHSKEGDK